MIHMAGGLSPRVRMQRCCEVLFATWQVNGREPARLENCNSNLLKFCIEELWSSERIKCEESTILVHPTSP